LGSGLTLFIDYGEFIMQAQTYELNKTYTFFFDQLVRSKTFNVRKIKQELGAKEQAGIEELGRLILSQGLLQNLVGFEQKKGKRSTGLIEIVAGGRRLTAIGWLISQGLIDPQTFPIEVRVCSMKEAISKSLAENTGREALPPADQFRAFKAMADEGHSCEEIATAFGTDEVTIKRRLKLANVSPRLFALYEENQATLDQLMALALTDDHATQEQVWDSLPSYNRTHHQIRNLITTQEVDIRTSRAAQFVGLEEYEAAGGEVRRDLFSNKGDGFMKDAALLESLAVAKLERLTLALKDRGWAWIDYCTKMDYSDLQKFMRVKTFQAPFSEEDQAKYDEMAQRYKSLLEQIEAHEAEGSEEDSEDRRDAYCALQTERAELEQKIETIEEAYTAPDPEMAAIAGVVVTLDYNSEIQIHRGMVRPEDQAQLKKSADDGKQGQEQKPKAVHSERLNRQLTAHRTAALQTVLAQRPDVALVVLAHKLALEVFKFGRHYCSTPSAAQIRLEHTDLTREGEDVSGCRALEKFAETRSEWENRFPESPDDLFGWLLQQDQSVILELLAFCTAFSLNTVQSNEAENKAASEVAKAVNLDMADWWEPTRESYFAQVSKQHTINIVAAEISPEVAKPLADLKKIPLAEAAEQKLHGMRWLPPILKAA
jgi:ParB family chromosome partitioning protein